MQTLGAPASPPARGNKLTRTSALPARGKPTRTSARPGWYSRGYLPHYDAEKLLQSVTYRLADSLPQEKLRQLEDELHGHPANHREAERRKRIEAWLDARMGCCALRHPEVARYVQDSFLHFHGERYQLHAWCVMPNHVHVLIEPLADLAVIVQGWKSFTARWILRQNARLALRIPDPDRLWMREYWDRYIRNAEHYQATVEYIQRNPAKAGLCRTPEEWPWSSANPGSVPGRADVLVGMEKGAVVTGRDRGADGDVGAPGDVLETPKVINESTTGSGCGLAIVAEFVSNAYGRMTPEEAPSAGYLGATVMEGHNARGV